jgi:hypothetical protein
MLLLYLMQVSLLFSGAIQEKDIPEPDTFYSLPTELIGDFVILTGLINKRLTIFPSNKYIIRSESWDHYSSEYGHIVQELGIYYFQPIGNRNIISENTKIYFSETGFYFNGKNPSYGTPYYSNYLFIVIRSRSITIDSASRDIFISQQDAKKQYFTWRLFNDTNIEITVNDLFNIIGQKTDSNIRHSLIIENGNVHILRYYFSDSFRPWMGFLEITRKNEYSIDGIIQFTNSMGNYHVKDGKANISILKSRVKL